MTRRTTPLTANLVSIFHSLHVEIDFFSQEPTKSELEQRCQIRVYSGYTYSHSPKCSNDKSFALLLSIAVALIYPSIKVSLFLTFYVVLLRIWSSRWFSVE